MTVSKGRRISAGRTKAACPQPQKRLAAKMASKFRSKKAASAKSTTAGIESAHQPATKPHMSALASGQVALIGPNSAAVDALLGDMFDLSPGELLTARRVAKLVGAPAETRQSTYVSTDDGLSPSSHHPSCRVPRR